MAVKESTRDAGVSALEQAVLYQLMLRPEWSQFLESDMLSTPEGTAIHAIIREYFESSGQKRVPPDSLGIYNTVRDLKEEESRYLSHMLGNGYTPLSDEDAWVQLERVRELGAYRQMVGHLGRASRLLERLAGKVPSRSGIPQALNELVIAQGKALWPTGRTITDVADEMARPRPHPRDLFLTGIHWWDAAEVPLWIIRGKYVVIAGRPKWGKSAWMAWMAMANARRGYRSLFISLEMGEEEITARMLAAALEVDHRVILTRPAAEWAMDQEAFERARELLRSIHIVRGLGFTVSMLKGLVMAREYDLVFIDYLQRIQSSQPGNRNTQLTTISGRLADLAPDAQVGMVLGSQLSREIEDREQLLPRDSDLRDSGSIEQDADIILFIVYEGKRTERTLYCTKNRGGLAEPKTGYKVGFAGQFMQFYKLQ